MTDPVSAETERENLAEADSDKYPLVEDLDGVWHRRPPGKPWITSDDGPNAETVCGRMVASAHVSMGWFPSLAEPRCEGCFV